MTFMKNREKTYIRQPNSLSKTEWRSTRKKFNRKWRNSTRKPKSEDQKEQKNKKNIGEELEDKGARAWEII